ncbi:MAG: DUF1799 domain-containing protein [Limnohabitans sp.]
MAEKIAASAPKDDFEVWEENWPTVEMFLRIQTQWRVAGGMGAAYVGLDYQAVAWMFSLYNVEQPRQMLEDLQVMEAAALTALNRRDD